MTTRPPSTGVPLMNGFANSNSPKVETATPSAPAASEAQRNTTLARVASSRVSDQREAERGHAHQAHLDKAVSGRKGVAAVRCVTDFEENQKGGEQHGERVGGARRQVVGLPAQEPPA